MQRNLVSRWPCFFFLMVACALGTGNAFSTPPAFPPHLARIKVHQIELKNVQGKWIPFSTKLSALNILSDDWVSHHPLFQATGPVPPGSYIAARITISRYFHIEWDYLETDNDAPVFYYTDTHNDDETFSAPGLTDLRKVSRRAQSCADYTLTSAEVIPIPHGKTYDSELAYRGFEQIGKDKHLLRKELLVPLFKIAGGTTPPFVQISFSDIRVIHEDILLKGGMTVRVLYPTVPVLSAEIVTTLCDD